MKCYLCEFDLASRKNKILSHTGLVEAYHFVCDTCYDEVENGVWEGFSIVN